MTDDTPSARPRPGPKEPAPPDEERQAGWTATRWVAILFLIPSVPMLLGSVAALALFYIAPVRFGGLIARLPGDEIIRTVLFFAPATLFALVVLAFLYAREPIPSAPAVRSPAQSAPVVGNPAQSLARWALALITPAFLVAIMVLLFSLAAPGRFSNWIEPLPGDRFLRPLIPLAPVLLLGLGVATILLAFPRRGAPQSTGEAVGSTRAARVAVGLILVSSLSMLALSLIALGMSYAQPDRFQRLMARLEPETFLRLALLFAPATLTAVVILALLYLIGRSIGEPGRAVPPPSVRLATSGVRSTLAVSVLVSGLLLSTLVALGLLGVLLVLLVR
ncbi:MAG TPA: hypothetical protein VJK02_16645 [Anaerolineales bacterium]|nr:hypothetical protein [Anaerolineales bacterium]